MEKLEPFSIVGGLATMENSLVDPQKIKHRVVI
jgi:hypothetical protein